MISYPFGSTCFLKKLEFAVSIKKDLCSFELVRSSKLIYTCCSGNSWNLKPLEHWKNILNCLILFQFLAILVDFMVINRYKHKTIWLNQENYRQNLSSKQMFKSYAWLQDLIRGFQISINGICWMISPCRNLQVVCSLRDGALIVCD